MIDHQILHRRFKHTIGITSKSLVWSKSYMSERNQHVRIANSTSNGKQLQYGVPKGSVLDPILYSIFTHLH